MPRKSLFRSAEKPLSQRHFYRYGCRNSISHKQSEYYAQHLKTRVFASETLSVNSIGTLAEFSTYALHKYTVPDEYSCITRLTLYLLIVIPLEYESYVVSLHKISCTREIKSKLSFLSFALSLHKISCTREIKSKLSFLSFALSLHKISCTREIKSKLSFLSFALSLHKTSIGSAVSSLKKLRFSALLLHSPCIIFA